MTGTYAGQFVMEGFLSIHWEPWKRVALTRCVALVPALTVAIISQSTPGQSDRMDEFLNVFQSIKLPFALLPVLHFTSSKVLMGAFANGAKTKILGWAIAITVCAINLYLVFQNLEGMDLHLTGATALICAGIIYFSFLTYLIHKDILQGVAWIKAYWTKC